MGYPMDELLGVYFFFAVFCGIHTPDPLQKAAWIPYEAVLLDEQVPEACYIGRDPGFPPSFDYPTNSEFYDV